MSDTSAWLRAHRALADWAFAVVLIAFSASQSLPALALSVGLAATVVARRRYPVVAFWLAVGLGVIQVWSGLRPAMADLALAVNLYELASRRPRRQSLAGLAGCLLVAAAALARWAEVYPGPLDAVVAGVAGLAVTAWVLGGSAQRARELQDRRARAVDTSAARLRQIERDLHDGAQVRLTALAMTLGEAKEILDRAQTGAGAAADETDRVRALVSAAHNNAKETMIELRDLSRGIHPPLLDRGLSAALAALAEASPVPATCTAEAVKRPSPAIEAIAYFCAAELLANASKHSGASKADVTVDSSNGSLTLAVKDDGHGGAHFTGGGGLAGLLARVQTVDGRMSVSSPPGGPTNVVIELPGHA